MGILETELEILISIFFRSSSLVRLESRTGGRLESSTGGRLESRTEGPERRRGAGGGRGGRMYKAH